jgi:cytochrome c-type biogenesis protein CcmH/NrfF
MSNSRRITRRASLFLGAALLIGLGSGASPARAADESWGYRLAHELMSPFCPGRTLAACTSPQAAELRQWILLQEAAGATREEVVANLEGRFGEVIKSEPKAEGWGLAAWLLPIAAMVIGAGVVALVLRRMTVRGGAPSAQQHAAAAPAAGPSDAELERLMEEELRASEL